MVHIVPQNDDRKHLLEVYCWCDPLVRDRNPMTGERHDEDGPILLHQAEDCREYAEAITGELLAQDKGWIILIQQVPDE